MCMRAEFKQITYVVENRVATITMNMPQKMNALDLELSSEIALAIADANADYDVKVIVLTGTGKAFCAGGDVSAFTKLDLNGAIAHIREGQTLVKVFTDSPKPIVAAVNGFAVGAGLSLVLLSDYVVASTGALFGAAFVNVGLVPDLAALYFLPRLVGLQKAKELAFTGKNIDAGEALRLGMVNDLAEPEAFAEAVAKISGKLARQPGLAMATAKNLLNKSLDVGLDELLELEAMAQGICMMSEDSKEGVDAFINKRKPNFK